ncbi:hypothetical protein [Anatilimnocola floriformis]|nr:hypothetical protein [Anatilimnocola floriformis]
MTTAPATSKIIVNPINLSGGDAMRTQRNLGFIVAVAAASLILTNSLQPAAIFAQGKNAEIGKPLQNPATPLVLPRPDFHFPGEIGRTYLDSDKAQFPKPVQPPKGAPNVVLILLDDVYSPLVTL